MVGRVRVAAEEPQTEKGMALFKEAFARCFRRGKGVVSMQPHEHPKTRSESSSCAFHKTSYSSEKTFHTAFTSKKHACIIIYLKTPYVCTCE